MTIIFQSFQIMAGKELEILADFSNKIWSDKTQYFENFRKFVNETQ